MPTPREEIDSKLTAARNVKILADIPESSLNENSVSLHKTYLDTIGRTSVTIKARNLVDEFRDRDLIISYDVSSSITWRKPLVIFSTVMTLYFAAWAIGKVEVGFAKK